VYGVIGLRRDRRSGLGFQLRWWVKLTQLADLQFCGSERPAVRSLGTAWANPWEENFPCRPWWLAGTGYIGEGAEVQPEKTPGGSRFKLGAGRRA
jgi:hypothetical protein